MPAHPCAVRSTTQPLISSGRSAGTSAPLAGESMKPSYVPSPTAKGPGVQSGSAVSAAALPDRAPRSAIAARTRAPTPHKDVRHVGLDTTGRYLLMPVLA